MAEDLLIQLLDGESGKLAIGGGPEVADVGVGGALLLELALGGHVVAYPWRYHKSSKVRLTDVSPPNDFVLVSALAQVAEKESSARPLVRVLGEGRHESLLARLEAGGIIQRLEDYAGWRPGPRRRWAVSDSGHKDDLHRQLKDLLIHRFDSDPRTAGLFVLLNAISARPMFDLERTPPSSDLLAH